MLTKTPDYDSAPTVAACGVLAIGLRAYFLAWFYLSGKMNKVAFQFPRNYSNYLATVSQFLSDKLC